ncbi:protein MAIN-LIKE 1-like [Papaver somniferum]|uniref:protein MAIN-LIKE 1-like n=1 Tax=Papaver somniferum TaxID=3469 RepID=UPI000E6FD51C|nr:protein MAIN-LIKE 1-like [Papaver somniferum]
MTITPDDADRILGLRARGKSVDAEYSELDWDQLYKLAEEVLGWDHNTTLKEFCSAAKEVEDVHVGCGNKPKILRSFKLKNLKDKFENTVQKVKDGLVMDATKINQTADAYLLHTLGRIIFPDHTGKKVSAQYLQFVKDLSKFHEYAWGSACVAFLLHSISTASRLDLGNIEGNFSLFQVWVYDHFPKLKLSTPIEVAEDTFPTSAKYEFKDYNKRDKFDKIISLREKLDSLDGHDVEFEPYNTTVEEDEFVEEEDIPLGMYYGPLFYPGGYVIFDPRRVLRKFGFIQTVPYDDNQKFKLLLKGGKVTKSTTSFWKPKYDPDAIVYSLERNG